MILHSSLLHLTGSVALLWRKQSYWNSCQSEGRDEETGRHFESQSKSLPTTTTTFCINTEGWRSVAITKWRKATKEPLHLREISTSCQVVWWRMIQMLPNTSPSFSGWYLYASYICCQMLNLSRWILLCWHPSEPITMPCWVLLSQWNWLWLEGMSAWHFQRWIRTLQCHR